MAVAVSDWDPIQHRPAEGILLKEMLESTRSLVEITSLEWTQIFINLWIGPYSSNFDFLQGCNMVCRCCVCGPSHSSMEQSPEWLWWWVGGGAYIVIVAPGICTKLFPRRYATALFNNTKPYKRGQARSGKSQSLWQEFWHVSIAFSFSSAVSYELNSWGPFQLFLLIFIDAT